MHIEMTTAIASTFQQLFPAADPWVANLGHTKLALFIQGVFAPLEVVHILGLFLLAGATLITGLRLMNLLLTEEPTSVVEKNVRPWLHLGVFLAIGSGLLMGAANAEKLFNSAAFLAKMAAMFAGIVFSYMVVVPTAKAEGQVRPIARVGAVIGGLLGLYGVFVFVRATGANAGLFHLLWAGTLIVAFALQGRIRWIFLGGLTAIIVVWQILTHLVVSESNYDPYRLINIIFMVVSAVWIFGLAGLNIFGRFAKPGSSKFDRMVAYVAILLWVMVGAGGRWIGLS